MIIDNNTPELNQVDTPAAPQVQVNRAYVDFLEAKLRRQHTLILEAQLWLSLGETRRATQALSQGLAYDVAALAHFGDYARTNLPKELRDSLISIPTPSDPLAPLKSQIEGGGK
jgi:hypothetical protein